MNPADHPDYRALAEASRAHDALAQQLGLHPFKDMLHLDEEAFRAFAVKRMNIPSTSSDFAREAMIKLFTDAFALGQAFAQRQEGR